LTGGQASIPGTLFGSLLVAVINNGLNLLNVSVFYQNVTLGLLLLGALGLTSGWTSKFGRIVSKESVADVAKGGDGAKSA
jgi:ribose/xylose/arabinose/galactoside ABC-type transport system permease subunit